MNESETRAELIDPILAACGWGTLDHSKIHREFRITDGRIQAGGLRAKPDIADYVLSYKNVKLAIVEAKSTKLKVGEGVAQAKEYAAKLQLPYAYSTNGKEIYEIALETGNEQLVKSFPSPDELWARINANYSEWQSKFAAVPFEDKGGSKMPRYYQEIAVNNVMDAIATGKDRVLLTLATGTGKTMVAFQVAWKLFQARWTLQKDSARRPRILFLADRNILADQAFNAFDTFSEDSRVRIEPDIIRKKGQVPTNGSVFFTIFQTFMTGPEGAPNYGGYPADFFDLIVIDECHRGGANDESNWRGILEYFSPAVQLGLTATPKRKDNTDTYKYFGDPVYTYSLKEGISDGFLTPFKVKRVQTTMDTYIYVSDDQIVEGEVEEGREYVETDFNRIIEIQAREAKRVDVLMSEIDAHEKTIVFCANQDHAAAVRELINQRKPVNDPHYCVRVTANDGALGETYLRQFQDNEKTIPTILTTSQKLSTGVDARNVRNIALLRPVNSMIEFKQIVGRGTRLFDGKEFFTILDFVGAYKHFADPEWDGEPIDETTVDKPKKPRITTEPTGKALVDSTFPPEPSQRVKIKLRDGKEREIQHMVSTSFWSADGKMMSGEEFLRALFGDLPTFFTTDAELRRMWSEPKTRRALLDRLEEGGYDKEKMDALKKLINAQDSDLFDVLAYVAFAIPVVTRTQRAAQANAVVEKELDEPQREFLDFVLTQYVESGEQELDESRLPQLLTLKYEALEDAEQRLGQLDKVKKTFVGFQKYLYQNSRTR